MRRIASSLIIALLLSSLFMLASTVQTARAQSGTIYINPNGSITPSTANITTSDNITYTFTSNNYLPIVVNRSNIVINGNADILQGSGTANGFSLTGMSNVTIRKTTIRNCYCGIALYSSPNCTVSENNLTATWSGVFLAGSSNCTVSENNLTNDNVGFYLFYSSNCTVSGNMLTNGGLALWQSSNNVVRDNLVDGKPLVYLEDVSNYSVTDAGQVVLVDCDSIVIHGLNLSYATIGAELWQTNNTRITNNNMTNDIDGIALGYSSNCTASGNNITNNTYVGIYLEGSSNNRFFDNFINNTQQVYSDGSPNTWDNGYPSGGNYWSNYNGTDVFQGPNQNVTGSDGIGDSPYVININNTDHYPLMGAFHAYLVPSHVPPFNNVTVISNSTITDFLTQFTNLLENPKMVSVSFNVTGKQGSTGFCRVSIPTGMMNGTFTVFVNGTEIPYALLPCSNANISYLYFSYKHSTEHVIIVPEFPSLLILPLLMMMLTAIVSKMKRKVAHVIKPAKD